jgi:beta-1,2-xylosyltransferase
MTHDLPWRQSHRVRLHHYANNLTNTPMEYMVPNLVTDGTEEGVEGNLKAEKTSPLGFETEEVDQGEARDFFFDMKLAGEPIQCSDEDGTCDNLG